MSLIQCNLLVRAMDKEHFVKQYVRHLNDGMYKLL